MIQRNSKTFEIITFRRSRYGDSDRNMTETPMERENKSIEKNIVY